MYAAPVLPALHAKAELFYLNCYAVQPLTFSESEARAYCLQRLDACDGGMVVKWLLTASLPLRGD